MIHLNPIERIIKLASTNPRIGGYRDYTKTIVKMKEDGVWQELHKEFVLSYISELSDIYDVKKGTLKQWHYNLKNKGTDWMPNHTRDISNHIFTDEDEKKIVQIIQIIINAHSHPITNAFIKNIMLSYYTKFKEPNENMQFVASNKYIRKFKRRHDFSVRRLHYKRRSDAPEEDIVQFLLTAMHIFKAANRDHIVNADETMWRCIQSTLTTWANKGADGIAVYTGRNEKDSFTALGSIAAAGKALPLVLIAEGKTKRCEANWFGPNRNIEEINKTGDEEEDEEEEEAEAEAGAFENPYHGYTSSRANSEQFITPSSFTDHSVKGWTTIETWKRYLYALRYRFIKPITGLSFYDLRNRIFLFADCYSAHFCQECMEYAHALNIEVIKIPEGKTDLFQPLDRKIFGIFKAKARAYINRIYCDEVMAHYDSSTASFPGGLPPPRAITKKEATAVLESAWNRLKPDTILAAWDESIETYFKDLEAPENEEEENISAELAFQETLKKQCFMQCQTNDELIDNIANTEKRVIDQLTDIIQSMQSKKKRSKSKIKQLFEIRKKFSKNFNSLRLIQNFLKDRSKNEDEIAILMDNQLPIFEIELFEILKGINSKQEQLNQIIGTIHSAKGQKLSRKIKEIENINAYLKDNILIRLTSIASSFPQFKSLKENIQSTEQ